MESPGGLYEKVAQRCIGLLFSYPSWSLLRKLWGHEDMLNNRGQGIGIDFSYREEHIVRESFGLAALGVSSVTTRQEGEGGRVTNRSHLRQAPRGDDGNKWKWRPRNGTGWTKPTTYLDLLIVHLRTSSQRVASQDSPNFVQIIDLWCLTGSRRRNSDSRNFTESRLANVVEG
jgi:hypothetical protein